MVEVLESDSSFVANLDGARATVATLAWRDSEKSFEGAGERFLRFELVVERDARCRECGAHSSRVREVLNSGGVCANIL